MKKVPSKKKKGEKHHSTPTEYLGDLPSHIRYNLFWGNVRTLGDLVKLSDKQILLIYKIGPKSLEKIHTFLHNRKLKD